MRPRPSARRCLGTLTWVVVVLVFTIYKLWGTIAYLDELRGFCGRSPRATVRSPASKRFFAGSLLPDAVEILASCCCAGRGPWKNHGMGCSSRAWHVQQHTVWACSAVSYCQQVYVRSRIVSNGRTSSGTQKVFFSHLNQHAS